MVEVSPFLRTLPVSEPLHLETVVETSSSGDEDGEIGSDLDGLGRPFLLLLVGQPQEGRSPGGDEKGGREIVAFVFIAQRGHAQPVQRLGDEIDNEGPFDLVP